MNSERTVASALEQGEGVLRLAPNWVPRDFCVPGRRIKLHPDDYYAMGAERGGIDERWFASTVKADNGPLTLHDEGLSYIVFLDGAETKKVLLKDAIEAAGKDIVGERYMAEHGGWPMFSKFFDNQNPLPHHVHCTEEDARKVGQHGKPEAYFFPAQMNNHGGDFPYTFFGLEAATTKAQVRECLENWDKGDNKITNLSRAYRLEPGTGWNVPAGVLHAPGSMCTYEPQKASDVFAMFQSMCGTSVLSQDLLFKDLPDDKKGDYDAAIDMLDWEANIDPEFVRKNFMSARPVQSMAPDGCIANWIVYKSAEFAAQELTVLPKAEVIVTDSLPYGFITVQGHGTFGKWTIDTPAIIRFGQLTNDEFFVSESAAGAGVRIVNTSDTDPLVMLKHFGPDHPDLPIE